MECTMPIYMDAPDEGRPISVKLTADVRPYFEAVRAAALATLAEAGFSKAEAADLLIRTEQSPTSAEAMEHFRRRWVLGVRGAGEAEIVWAELPRFESPTVDEFRRLFLGEIVEARLVEDGEEPS
jgi:hypothetical protein